MSDNFEPSSFRFPKAMRLRTAEEFKHVYEFKASVSDACIVLFARNNNLGYPRLGVSVGRKIGNAVVRTRLKRLFREAFRLTQHLLPRSYDFIMIPRAQTRYAILTEIQSSLINLATLVTHRTWSTD